MLQFSIMKKKDLSNTFIRTYGPYILFMLVLNIFFFLPLFLPQNNALINPEFRGGDIVNMHYPYKYFMKQKLDQGLVPFWSRVTSAGFPIYAQSEIGFFNPINFLTLKFFPLFTAINLQFILVFFWMMISTFSMGVMLNLSRRLSLLFAIIFSYSSFNIFNFIHFPHLQTIAYMPVLFGLAYSYLHDKKLKRLLIMIPLFALQLVSGHLQYVYITLMMIYVYVFVYYFLYRKQIVKKEFAFFLITVTLSFLFACIIAAIQLIPTIEFARLSPRLNVNQIGSGMVNYLFSPKIILTLISPYIFGNPKYATYPLRDLIAPWDSSFFLGWIPLLGLIMFLVSLKKTINTNIRIFGLLFIIFLLLAWEGGSPLYLLFYIPPFSLFRFNSRFVIINILILSLFVVIGLNQIETLLKKKKKVYTILFLTLVISLCIERFLFTYSYNNLIPASQYIKKPEIAEKHIINSNDRIYSFGSYGYISDILVAQGFNKDKTIFLNILKNTLSPDINIIYDTQSFNNSISGYNVFRLQLMLSDIEEHNNKGTIEKSASISAVAKNIFTVSGVNKIVSLLNISYLPYARKTYTFTRQSKNIPPVSVYDIVPPNSRVRFYQQLLTITTLKEFKNALQTVDLKKYALVEKDLSAMLEPDISSTDEFHSAYTFVTDSDEYVKLKTTTNKSSFMTLADTNYPGWEAYIDGNKTSIYTANLLFRGLIVPKGSHIIEFKYIPRSFYLGRTVTFVALIIYIILIIMYRANVLRFSLNLHIF